MTIICAEYSETLLRYMMLSSPGQKILFRKTTHFPAYECRTHSCEYGYNPQPRTDYSNKKPPLQRRFRIQFQRKAQMAIRRPVCILRRPPSERSVGLSGLSRSCGAGDTPRSSAWYCQLLQCSPTPSGSAPRS